MRLFLAIELSPEFRSHLTRLQSRLRPVARASYTKPENLHLTLKFLGEVPDAEVKPICDALAGIPAVGEIPLKVESVVCFPERGPIRIIGAGPNSVPGALGELVERLEGECERLGFRREGRAYHPHITIARAREPLHGSIRPRLEEAVAGDLPGPDVMAAEFVLMESNLKPEGPVYTPAARFSLGGGPSGR